MRTINSTKLFYFLLSLFFILQIVINVNFCNCQEYRIKESLQLLWNEEFDTWENAYKIVHKYDEHGRRIGFDDFKWDYGKCWIFVTVEYKYDSEGKLTECQLTNFETKRTIHLESLFDNNGNLTEIKKITFGNSWADSAIISVKYDQFKNLIKYRYEGFPNWYNFKYQTNGKYVSVNTKLLIDAYEHYQKWIYVRNNGTNKLQQNIRPSRAWADRDDGHYVYILFNHNHFLIFDEIFPYDHERDYFQQIHFITPNSFSHNPIHNGKILYYLEKFKSISKDPNDQDVDHWQFFKRIYEYDEQDRLMKDSFAYKDSVVFPEVTFVYGWVTGGQNFYYYDEKNNCTKIISQYWHNEDEKWVDFSQYFYTYEETNKLNLTSEEENLKSNREEIQLKLTNSPNPFNQSTTIYFELPKPANVTLQIFDVQGKEVKTLISTNEYQKGKYSHFWNGTNNSENSVASGIYFIRLQVDQKYQTKLCLLIR